MENRSIITINRSNIPGGTQTFRDAYLLKIEDMPGFYFLTGIDNRYTRFSAWYETITVHESEIVEVA